MVYLSEFMNCYFFKTLRFKHSQDSNISTQKLIESVAWLIPDVIIFTKISEKIESKQIVFFFNALLVVLCC